MHSAVILADENNKLRTENERQKKKRCVRGQYIATGGVLTIQEGLDRINSTGLGANSEIVGGGGWNNTKRVRHGRVVCVDHLHTLLVRVS
jgi:hypothetical protein